MHAVCTSKYVFKRLMEATHFATEMLMPFSIFSDYYFYIHSVWGLLYGGYKEVTLWATTTMMKNHELSGFRHKCLHRKISWCKIVFANLAFQCSPLCTKGSSSAF